MSHTPLTIAREENDVRWYRLFIRKTELEVKELFDAVRSTGVEPILLKGWAAAQNYPQGHPRLFSDIDLAVPAEDFKRCFDATELRKLTTLSIDWHCGFRHLDKTPWAELFARSQTVEIEGTNVRVLRPEDHLRVLCTHWLTDGGQYKERLWDIYYAIANRPPDFDWELCLNSVSATRRNWVITSIAIAKKYLDLDIQTLPFREELEHIPLWIDKCLAREWASQLPLRSLHTCLNDPRMLMRQLRKRIPPNPIQATVETESLFDDRNRLPKQFRSIAIRIGPSLIRVVREAASKIWK